MGGVCSSAVVLQVLIFSQMTSILDILMDYCYLRGFQYSRLDGSMAYADREENVSDGDLQLCPGTPRSAHSCSPMTNSG